MELKLVKEDLFLLQDIAYYFGLIDIYNHHIESIYDYKNYICNSQIGGAYLIVLERYVKNFNYTDFYEKHKKLNNQIVRQINYAIILNDDNNYSLSEKKEIKKKEIYFTITYDNGIYTLYLNEEYIQALKYDVLIFKHFKDKNIDEICNYYANKYSGIDSNIVKEYYNVIFNYYRVSDFASKLITFFDEKVGY